MTKAVGHRSTRLPGWLAMLLLVLGVVAGTSLGVVVHMAAGGTRVEALALPALHGQASWGPAERRAPVFTLRDQDGARISLSALRGRPVVITFLDSRCKDQCPLAGRALGTLLRDLRPADRPTLVVVSVDPGKDTAASIRHAVTAWRLAGPWRWHWLQGTQRQLEAVWRDYGILVEPNTNDVIHGLPLYLIDRRGFQRTGYLFPFLPNFVGLDLATLAREDT